MILKDDDLGATVGSLLGAWALYGIARWIGLERIQRIVDRIPGVDREDVAKADRWFTPDTATGRC